MKKTSMCMGLLAGVILVSCAETAKRWEHPSKPEAAWAEEEADCRRWASDIAEREFRQRSESGPATESRQPAVIAEVDRFEAQRRQAQLVERCMTAKGFVRVEAEPPETPAQ